MRTFLCLGAREMNSRHLYWSLVGVGSRNFLLFLGLCVHVADLAGCGFDIGLGLWGRRVVGSHLGGNFLVVLGCPGSTTLHWDHRC